MASVPRSVRIEVCRTLDIDEDRIQAAQPTSGGCISHAVRLDTGPDRFFLKWREQAPPDFFEREAQGLAALATGPLWIPEVVAHGTDWLLLDWVESVSPEGQSWERLGRGLAELHRNHIAAHFGWIHPNFIGSLPQPNDQHDSWGTFWCDVRLRPLMEQALAQGLLGKAESERLTGVLETIPGLIDAIGADEGPSLLHGDLWSGNVMFATPSTGRTDAVVIDPAVYSGHREVDLAMTRLFGGFPESFYNAYQEEWPLAGGVERRLAVYQLYPLLVHLLLFGRGYAARLMATAGQVLER